MQANSRLRFLHNLGQLPAEARHMIYDELLSGDDEESRRWRDQLPVPQGPNRDFSPWSVKNAYTSTRLRGIVNIRPSTASPMQNSHFVGLGKQNDDKHFSTLLRRPDTESVAAIKTHLLSPAEYNDINQFVKVLMEFEGSSQSPDVSVVSKKAEGELSLLDDFIKWFYKSVEVIVKEIKTNDLCHSLTMLKGWIGKETRLGTDEFFPYQFHPTHKILHENIRNITMTLAPDPDYISRYQIERSQFRPNSRLAFFSNFEARRSGRPRLTFNPTTDEEREACIANHCLRDESIFFQTLFLTTHLPNIQSLTVQVDCTLDIFKSSLSDVHPILKSWARMVNRIAVKNRFKIQTHHAPLPKDHWPRFDNAVEMLLNIVQSDRERDRSRHERLVKAMKKKREEIEKMLEEYLLPLSLRFKEGEGFGLERLFTHEEYAADPSSTTWASF